MREFLELHHLLVVLTFAAERCIDYGPPLEQQPFLLRLFRQRQIGY
jgi:hypothetical protein